MIVQETLWGEKQKGVGSVKSEWRGEERRGEERRGEEKKEKKMYAVKPAATEYNTNASILEVHSQTTAD